MYRSIGTRSRPTLECESYPLAALREHLPDPYPTIDAATRAGAAGEKARRGARPLPLTHGVVTAAPARVGHRAQRVRASARLAGRARLPRRRVTARHRTRRRPGSTTSATTPGANRSASSSGRSRKKPTSTCSAGSWRATRSSACAREPPRSARDARRAPRDPRRSRSTRRCSWSAPVDRAPRCCTSCSRRIRRIASRARGSCSTRARRRSASTYTTDPRIAAADQEYTFWHLIAPEYRTMHENGGDVPNEDPLIDMLEFASDHFMGSYRGAELRPLVGPRGCRHRSSARTGSFLQLLQWRCRGERWILKSPSYLGKLPAFFAEYPDAYVILTHRDPLKVLPSLVSLMATLRWMHSDAVDVEAVVKSAVHGTAIAMDYVMQCARRRHAPRRPDHRRSVRRPRAGSVGARCARCTSASATPLTGRRSNARCASYLDARPRERHGRHDYDFADTGLDLEATRARFADTRPATASGRRCDRRAA